jgi:hypothetical protein
MNIGGRVVVKDVIVAALVIIGKKAYRKQIEMQDASLAPERVHKHRAIAKLGDILPKLWEINLDNGNAAVHVTCGQTSILFLSYTTGKVWHLLFFFIRKARSSVKQLKQLPIFTHSFLHSISYFQELAFIGLQWATHNILRTALLQFQVSGFAPVPGMRVSSVPGVMIFFGSRWAGLLLFRMSGLFQFQVSGFAPVPD